MNPLIQKLKANIFEADLMNTIEGDAQLGIDIWRLLDELNKKWVSDSMIQFPFEFETYFDQVCKDIDLKQTNNARLQ